MSPLISMYLAQGLHGIAYGMVLFLIASGLNIIFGMMGILNLAHSAFFMLSAYFCYQLTVMVDNFLLTLLLAPLITAFLGIILQQLFFRKALPFGQLGELILTMGIASIITAVIKIFWGTENLIVSIPQYLSGMVTLGGMKYPIYRLFVIGMSFVVLAVMIMLLYKTRLGKIVRAAVSDREMVSALGINVSVVFMLVFGIGTWLAGVAGVVISPILTVHPNLANQIGMDAFIVVVTGGFGSLLGAFIVAIIFGLLNAFGIQLFSQLSPIIIVCFMAGVLLFRPQGLMGVRE